MSMTVMTSAKIHRANVFLLDTLQLRECHINAITVASHRLPQYLTQLSLITSWLWATERVGNISSLTDGAQVRKQR